MKRLYALACLTAVAFPAAAGADEPIAEVAQDAPVASHDGWSAYSRSDGERFQLVLRDPSGRAVVPSLPSSSKPWDVSLGPDGDGDVVAVYQRCTSHGCDVRRLDPATGHEQTLASVSSSSSDEATPAIWGHTVAFTRRVDGCDVPYVKTLGSSVASRRLLRDRCVQTPAGHLALRGSNVVTSSAAGEETSELRRFSTLESGSSVLLRSEEARYGQVAFDGDFATTVRYGMGVEHAFVRIPADGGRAEDVPAHLTLTGSYAKGLYVEAQDAETDTCTVPCRVVAAPDSPFGSSARTLPPQLSVSYASSRGGNPPSSEPLPFRGTLTRFVVASGDVVRSEPVAGAEVELRQRTADGFAPTTYRAVTGADGSYQIVVPPPIPHEPWFTAVARTSPVVTWAGSGTTGLSAP